MRKLFLQKFSFVIYEGVLHFCSCFLQKNHFFGKNMFFLTSCRVYEGRQRFKIVKIDDFRSFQSKILAHLTRSTYRLESSPSGPTNPGCLKLSI